MSNKTALVIDDSKSARFALRRHLEHHAYQVDTAESAEEAYALLKRHHPQVIFLDHVMPGTDGFTALSQLKSDPETDSIPVVICSSNEGADFTAEARAKGAIGVLQKPPTPEQLVQVLDNLQALSQQLKSAPRSEPAPAAESKVTSLREPDVTIGQAVMNVLRNSLTQAPAASPDSPAATTEPAAAAIAPGLQREQFESRLKKLTQEIYLQISELKATLAVVESRVREPEEEQELLESASRRTLAEVQQQIEALERRIDDRFAGLQAQFDAMLQAQDQRIAEVEQMARTVATEAAHTESERTVMSAAARIADQLADSILKALGRK